MKWILTIVSIIGFSFLATAWNMLPLEGGSSDGSDTFHLPRNPFHHYITLGEDLIVSISHPEEGGEYHTNTQDLNATVTGGTGTYTCWYRINDNDWNLIDCPGGIISESVTLPFGSVTVYVYVESGGFTGQDSVGFTVYGINQAGPLEDMWLLAIPLMVALGMVLFE